MINSLDKMNERKCRFCGSNNLSKWTVRPVPYLKCIDCNFIQVKNLPTKEEFDLHYSDYHNLNHQASPIKNNLRQISYQQESAWLVNQIFDVAEISLCDMDHFRVFDFGGSGGYFLDSLKVFLFDKLNPKTQLSLDCSDKSESAVDVLKEKGYYLPEARAFENYEHYDLVILRGVIEHVPNFKDIIRSLCCVIKPLGFLFITATPNGSSAAATLYRDGWVQHHYPSHIHHFSENHFDILLSTYGLIRYSSTDLYTKSPYADPFTHLQKLSQAVEKTMNKKSLDIEHIDSDTRHAFPGSMLTLLYQKI